MQDCAASSPARASSLAFFCLWVKGSKAADWKMNFRAPVPRYRTSSRAGEVSITMATARNCSGPQGRHQTGASGRRLSGLQITLKGKPGSLIENMARKIISAPFSCLSVEFKFNSLNLAPFFRALLTLNLSIIPWQFHMWDIILDSVCLADAPGEHDGSVSVL